MTDNETIPTVDEQPVPIKPQPIDFLTSADGGIAIRMWLTPTEMLTWHDTILEFMRMGAK